MRVRGGPDPRVSRNRAEALYRALHGLAKRAAADGTWLTLAAARGTPRPMGADSTGRQEHVVNFRPACGGRGRGARRCRREVCRGGGSSAGCRVSRFAAYTKAVTCGFSRCLTLLHLRLSRLSVHPRQVWRHGCDSSRAARRPRDVRRRASRGGPATSARRPGRRRPRGPGRPPRGCAATPRSRGGRAAISERWRSRFVRVWFVG
ncbi:minor capsid protein [Streptomyces sp. S1D4-11]